MIIALDVDDVIAAFTPHAHKFYGKPLEERLNYWSVPLMDERLGKGWFMDGIRLNKKFWETVPAYSAPSSIDFKVAYYISSFPEEMYDVRARWLRRHRFPKAPLICASNKLEKCLELGVTVLVDDKPATIQSLQGSPVKGIHFITHYAGFAPVGDYVTSLKQVKQYL